MMGKRRWNSDKLIGLSALVISISTLVVFMYQTSLIRKQQFMSVYPHLEFGNFASGSLKYRFELANVGIGPAFIQKVTIKNGSAGTYDDLVDYVDDVVYEPDSIMYVHSNLYKGRVIKEDEEIPVIQLLDQDLLNDLGFGDMSIPQNTIASSSKLYQLLNHDSLEIEIVYSSVYGETWKVSNKARSPIKQ